MSRTHQMAFELAGKISSQFKQAFQSANSHVQRLGGNIRQLEKTSGQIQSYQQLQQETQGLQQEFTQAQAEVDRLGREMEATDRPSREMRQNFQQAQKRANSLQQQLERKQNSLERTGSALREAGVNTENLADEQRNLQRQLEYSQERMRGMQRIAGADLPGNLRRTGTEMRRVATRAGALATGAAAGIFGLAKSTADLGDEAAKTAAALGMHSEELQELQYAAQRSGVETSTLDSSLQRMIRRTSEAAQGSGEAADAIAELGLSAHELTQMGPQEQVHKLADAFQDVENHSDRARLAHDIFGRSGMDLVNMLQHGSKGLEDMGEQAHRVGYVLSGQAAKDSEEFTDALGDVQANLRGVRNILGAELMPIVTRVMEQFSEYVIKNRDRVEEFAQVFAQRVKEALPIIRDMAEGVWRVAQVLGNLIRTVADAVGGFDRLAMIVAGLFTAKLIIAVAALGKSLIMVASGLGILVKAWVGLNAAMLASPIFWIPAAIAALGVAAYYLITRWDKVVEFFSGAWQRLKDVFASIDFAETGKDLIKALVSGIKSMASAPIDAVKNVAGNVRDMLPFSDAKEGPFSDLTKAGMAIPKTLGEGLKRATPDFQQRAKQVLAGGMAAIPLMSTPDMAGAEPRIQDQFASATIQPEHIQSRDPLDQRLDAPSQQNLSSPAVNINQTFEINGTAGSDPDARRVGEEAGKQARRAVEDFFRREQRLSYA